MEKANSSCQSELLKVQELVSGESFSEALAELERLRSAVSHNADATDTAQMLLLHSECLCGLGRYREALTKIKAAIRLASKLNNHSLYAKLKLTYGIVLSRLGRVQDAEQEFIESYAFYKRVKDYKAMVHPLEVWPESLY